MLDRQLRDLVQAAATHAEEHADDADHTVAAALLTGSGRTVLGLNAYHFLGGPCGEITALANHAAECPQDPVSAVVAVHGPGQQVIPPCGKCRQVLFDIDPTIRCVIRGSNGLEAQTIGELLPHAYDWRATEQAQLLYMWQGYESSIRDGSKRQTIRVDDPFRPGAAHIVFEKDDGTVVTIGASICSVTPMRRCDLTDTHAQRDGFTSVAEMHEALDTHYPGLGMDDPVDVVTFELSKQQ